MADYAFAMCFSGSSVTCGPVIVNFLKIWDLVFFVWNNDPWVLLVPSGAVVPPPLTGTPLMVLSCGLRFKVACYCLSVLPCGFFGAGSKPVLYMFLSSGWLGVSRCRSWPYFPQSIWFRSCPFYFLRVAALAGCNALPTLSSPPGGGRFRRARCLKRQ